MAYYKKRKRYGKRRSFKRRGFRRGNKKRSVIKRAIRRAVKWARGKSRKRILKAYLAKVGKSKHNRMKR